MLLGAGEPGVEDREENTVVKCVPGPHQEEDMDEEMGRLRLLTGDSGPLKGLQSLQYLLEKQYGSKGEGFWRVVAAATRVCHTASSGPAAGCRPQPPSESYFSDLVHGIWPEAASKGEVAEESQDPLKTSSGLVTGCQRGWEQGKALGDLLSNSLFRVGAVEAGSSELCLSGLWKREVHLGARK